MEINKPRGVREFCWIAELHKNRLRRGLQEHWDIWLLMHYYRSMVSDEGVLLVARAQDQSPVGFVFASAHYSKCYPRFVKKKWWCLLYRPVVAIRLMLKVLGKVSAQKDVPVHKAEIMQIAVALGAEGHGVGSKLLNAAEQAMRETGVSELWLRAFLDEEKVVSFYEQRGYKKMASERGRAILRKKLT